MVWVHTQFIKSTEAITGLQEYYITGIIVCTANSLDQDCCIQFHVKSMVRGSHCHMISCVPPSTTTSSLHFSIRIHDLKGVPLLAIAFVCFEKGIACEEVPSLHTCLSNLFAIVTHGSIQSACFESCTCVRAYPGGNDHCHAHAIELFFPVSCHQDDCHKLCSKMPRLTPYLKNIPSTIYTHTHIFPTTPGWRHGTSNPRPCGTKRSHEATAS